MLGPFQPDLETALAEKVRAAKAEDGGAPVVVLVGSNMLGLYLCRLLAEQMPLWNVRFLTFAKIARKLGTEKLRSLGRALLPQPAERFIIRETIEDHGAGYFEPVTDLPGFVRTAAASVKDMKEAGLGPDALGREKGRKIASFKKIFQGYEATLERLARYDEADLMAAAAETAPTSPFVTSADLVVYGFYDLNGLQRRLVLALAAGAKSAAAMVPALEVPAHEYARPLVNWFKDNDFTPDAAPSDNDALTARLFAPPQGKSIDDGRFRIVSAPGETREVREVLRQVLEFAAGGIAFHQIGVLLRNPDTYSRLLRDAFDRRGIPCFVCGGMPLGETREARSIEMLAALLASDLPRVDVVQFVHFAPIRFEELLGHTPSTSDWAFLSIKAGVVSGAAEWVRRLARLETRRGEERTDSPRRELPHLAAFIKKLIEAKESVPSSGSWAEIIGAFVRVCEQFIKPSAGRDRVCAELRKLSDLDKFGIGATFDEVRRSIAELLERQRIQPEGFQRGKVCIGSLFELRGLRFEAVVIPRVVEKGFPAVGRQDPILLDPERAAISEHAGADAHLPQKSARTDEERMLFALAAASAAKHVTLTFSRLDVITARERITSHFLTRLVEALTGNRCDYSSLESAECFVRTAMFPSAAGAGQELDLDEYELSTIARLFDTGKPREVLYLGDLSEQFRRGIEAETARWQEKRFTKFDGIVVDSPHTNIAGEVMSPTRIETYATCPFTYFVKYVLGIEVLDEPENIHGLPPRDRGALIHRILRTAYHRCFFQNEPVSAERLFAELRRAAQAEFKKLAIAVPLLVKKIEREKIVADLIRFARFDMAECEAAGARPALFETRFGMPTPGSDEGEASAEEPLELSIRGKTYRFKGKIDRIDDLGTDRARVIDYKTGKKVGRKDSFQQGRALQLPIYLLAARMLRPERQVVSAAYWFVTRHDDAPVSFGCAALDKRMEDLEQVIATVESGIGGGLFIAKPEEKVCRNCEFKDICGVNREVIFERKKDDPAIADLLKLAEIK